MSSASSKAPWGASEQPFEFEYALTVEDYIATRHARAEVVPFWPYLASMAVLGIGFSALWAHEPWSNGNVIEMFLIFFMGMISGSIIGWVSHYQIKAFIDGFYRGFLRKRGAIDVPVHLCLSSAGVICIVRGQEWKCPWESLHSAEQDEGRFYFWTSAFQAVVLPKRAVSAHADIDKLTKGIEQWRGGPISALSGPPHNLTRPTAPKV